MATRTRIIGPISAYGIAKAHGYTGSEADFADEIANASINAQKAETAADKCENLTASLPDDFTDVLDMITENEYPASGMDFGAGNYLMHDGKLYRCFETFTSTGVWATDSAAYLEEVDIGWELKSLAVMRDALRKMSLRLTGMDIIPFVSGAYSTTVTAKIGSPSKTKDYVCAISPCQPGDVFYAKATKTISGTANVPWVYFDAEGNVLDRSGAPASIDGIMVVPETFADVTPAYLAVNNRIVDNPDDYYLIKCKTTLVNRVDNLEAFRSNGAALINYGSGFSSVAVGNATCQKDGFRVVINGTMAHHASNTLRYYLTLPKIAGYNTVTYPDSYKTSGMTLRDGHKYRVRMRHVSGTATMQTTEGTVNIPVYPAFKRATDGTTLGGIFIDDRTGEYIAEYVHTALNYSGLVHLCINLPRNNPSPAEGSSMQMDYYTADIIMEDVTYSDLKLNNIAPVETVPASFNHNAGDLIIVSGNPYKCLVSITPGMDLTSGYNIDSTKLRLTSLSEEIAALGT